MKSYRSQGGAIRKRGMAESLSIERARQNEAIGLRQCWSESGQCSVLGHMCVTQGWKGMEVRHQWSCIMGQLLQAARLWNKCKRTAVAGRCHDAKKIHFKTLDLSLSLCRVERPEE